MNHWIATIKSLSAARRTAVGLLGALCVLGTATAVSAATGGNSSQQGGTSGGGNKSATSLSAAAPTTDISGVAIGTSAISAVLTNASGATGMITFKVVGPLSTAPTQAACATGTNIGSAPVSGNGTYHPSAGFTPRQVGTYYWYASYSGDVHNAASNSQCGSVRTAVQDFTVSSSSASQTALTDGSTDDSAAYPVAITPSGGFSGSVTLSVSGLPSGTTPSFNPNPASPSTSPSTLTIDVGTAVTPGSYPLTVTGTTPINGTSVTRTAQLTLVIHGSQPFTISGDVPSPLYPGAAAQSFTITLTNPNSFPIKVASLGSVDIQAPSAPTCLPDWFIVTLPTVPSTGMTIAAGSSQTVTATAQMTNVDSSQDACKGQQLMLTYSGTYTK